MCGKNVSSNRSPGPPLALRAFDPQKPPLEAFVAKGERILPPQLATRYSLPLDLPICLESGFALLFEHERHSDPSPQEIDLPA